MILIFASILLAGAASCVLLWFGEQKYNSDYRHMIATIVGVSGVIVTGISVILYAFAVWVWIAAEYKAEIINREYNTHYTQAEIFYASDVIEIVRQLDRKRYEINGNIPH